MQKESKNKISDECGSLLLYYKYDGLIEEEIIKIYNEIDIPEIKNLCSLLQFNRVIRLIFSIMNLKKMFPRSVPMILILI
jgi:hypothetical protein